MIWISRFQGPAPYQIFVDQKPLASEDPTYPEVNINVDSITRTSANNLLPSSSALRVRKFGRCNGVDHLIDAWTSQFNFSIICIADGNKRKHVMATTFGLQCQICSRRSKGLGDFARMFIVTLYAIINLERCRSV
jgi:hypothetical protein